MMINEKCGTPAVHVMEIERFAIHDGPGIRTAVFLQGCPLLCPWCSNPESQKIRKQLMHFSKKCIGCGKCKEVCDQNAVEIRDGRPVFDRNKCSGCGICADHCLSGALRISGEDMTAEEIMGQLLRDRDYYEKSGGGVTFSGGEPFVQYDNLLELLKLCKQNGIHTAVETTGDVLPERFKAAEKYIDLFLFDMKHTDVKKLADVTGGNVKFIFENLRYLASRCPDKVTLRMPVIPTFNYDDASIDGVFEIARTSGFSGVDLIPYHTLGKDKYERLGRNYSFPVEKMLNKEDLLIYKKRGEKLGLRVSIGG